MIKEFEGRKFKTRDGKYDADIVAYRALELGSKNPYPYWVILTPATGRDKARIYTEDLRFCHPSLRDGDLDLIEIQLYDWPLMAPVFAWDESCKPPPRTPDRFPHGLEKFFGGVNAQGKPTTRYLCGEDRTWHTFAWDHAELIPLPMFIHLPEEKGESK